MKHLASPKFWSLYGELPNEVQLTARKCFDLLKSSPEHPSLHFKQLKNRNWFSARVGIHYRVLGIPVDDGIEWFWIGSHAEYNRLVR